MSKINDFFEKGEGWHSYGPLKVLPKEFPSLSQKFLKEGSIKFFTKGPFEDVLLKNNDFGKKPQNKLAVKLKKQTPLQQMAQMKMNVNG